MREYPGHRLGRLLAILAALAGGARTRAELARLFATSERTIQKDVSTLAREGLVTHGREGYQLTSRARPVAPGQPIAPGFAVSVSRRRVELVRLRPRGTVTWVEEPVRPQPPADLLRPYQTAGDGERRLHALTSELVEWVERTFTTRPSGLTRTAT